MTAKEKAEELFNKMFNIPDGGFGSVGVYEAKQCALIAVDEMLNNAGFIWGGRDTETGLSARDSYRKYLQEVKQEIEKL
jgi:hypothetical protein